MGQRFSLAPAVLLLATLPALAQGQTSTPELWVLAEGSRNITALSTADYSTIATIDVSDPDNDTVPETPYDLCFSTHPPVRGLRGYVTSEEFLIVVDVQTHAVLHSFNLASLLGSPGIQLRGCDSAVPREFVDPASGLPVIESYLFVAATTATGDALAIVLDQADLELPTSSPEVDDEVLVAGADALDVVAIDGPRGPAHQRAWFTVREQSAALDDQLHGVELTTGNMVPGPGSYTVGRMRTTVLSGGALAPDRLQPAMSRGREFHAMPLGPDAKLMNFESGGDCPAGSNLVAAWFAGPGPGAYTVFAADRDGDQVHVIEPGTCNVDSYTVGDEPVALVSLGRMFWRTAFTANRGSDDLTRIERDGTVAPVPLPAGVIAPVALGVPYVLSCDPKNVQPSEPMDLDNDLIEDDIRVTWDGGCNTGDDIWVWCTPGCGVPPADCQCDCFVNPPTPGCACPGVGPMAFAGGVDDAPDFPLLVDPPCLIGANGWKKLGSSGGGNNYDHFDGGEGDGQSYDASQSEDDPP